MNTTINIDCPTTTTSLDNAAVGVAEAGTPAKKTIQTPRSELEDDMHMLTIGDDDKDERRQEEDLRNSLLLEKQGRGSTDGGPTESNKGMNSQLDKIMRGESGEIRKFGDNSWMRDREDQRVCCRRC